MRRLLIVGLAMILSPMAMFAAITIGAHQCNGSGDGNAVTTTAINTTGASAIILAVGSAHAAATITPTDLCGGGACSPLNTWTCLTEQDGTTVRSKICYVLNPTTSAVHTFSLSTALSVPGLCALALNGTLTTGAFDVQNGNKNSAGTTLQIGSVLPSVHNEIIIDAIALTDTNAPTIDAGQTRIDFVVGSATSEGVAIAYEIQTAKTARNPTWTFGSSVANAAVNATFKSTIVLPVFSYSMLQRRGQ